MKIEITPAMAFLLGVLACLIGLTVNYAFLADVPLQTLSTFPAMKITVGGVEYRHLLYNLIVLVASLILILSGHKTVKLIGFFFLGVAVTLLFDEFVLSNQFMVGATLAALR